MTRVVQLSDDASARLHMLKRGRESFSDVVLRLAGRGDLTQLRRLRPPSEIDAAERAIGEIDALDRT